MYDPYWFPDSFYEDGEDVEYEEEPIVLNDEDSLVPDDFEYELKE